MRRSRLFASLLVLLIAGAALRALWTVPDSERRDAGASGDPRTAAEGAEPAVELVPAVPPSNETRVARGETSRAPEIVPVRANPTPQPGRAGMSLHVRDGASGRELAPVFVLELERRLAASLEHPGAAGERAEERRSSPVPLDLAVPELCTLFARSPGYAWGRVEFRASETERFLDLEPGGAVRVRVAGGRRDPGTKLRVFRATPEPLLELDLDSTDELLIEDLHPGRVEVAAELGSGAQARALAREAVEIVAGATEDVTLVLEPVEPARWVPLAGSLVLPREWDLDAFQLTFQLEGPALERWSGKVLVDRVEMTLENREAGLYLWQAQEVQPGVYATGLAALGYRGEIVVGANGERDVRIAIGAPCEVSVRCVDDVTGKLAADVRLAWSLGATESEALVPVTVPDDAHDGFVFRAPCGPIRVRAVGPDFEPESRVFELRPGRNELELTVHVRVPMGLRVKLRDGPTPVAWDPRTLPTLEALDGQPFATPRFRNGALEFLTKLPGRYRLRVPPIAGYRPMAARIVEVGQDALTELVLELTREP